MADYDGAVDVSKDRKRDMAFQTNVMNANLKNFWDPICDACARNAWLKGQVNEAEDCTKFKTMKLVRHTKVILEKIKGGNTFFGLMLDFKCPLGHGWSKELNEREIKAAQKILVDKLKMDKEELVAHFGEIKA